MAKKDTETLYVFIVDIANPAQFSLEFRANEYYLFTISETTICDKKRLVRELLPYQP